MGAKTDAVFSFERLEVWQKAVNMATRIYDITKGFPKEELFGLTMQLRRAGVSVAANIAEGTSRSTGKDQSRFYEMAYGSLNEIITMLYIASKQGMVDIAEYDNLKIEISDLCRMISGLRRSALSREDKFTLPKS